MTERIKPVVHYRNGGFIINVGMGAVVYGLDHPRIGQDWITTSEVLSYDSNTGEFETLNTLYVPEKV